MVENNIIEGWDSQSNGTKSCLDIPDGLYVNLGIGIPEK